MDCRSAGVDFTVVHTRTRGEVLGKVARSHERTCPKKFLSAWMNKPKKMEVYNTHVIILSQKLSQQSCLKKKDLNNQCCFKDWIPVAKDGTLWLAKINEHFNSCKTIDEEKDDKEEDGDET